MATQPEQAVPECPVFSLAEAPHRQPWRKRGAIEVENVMVLQSDSPAGGRCARARLMSTVLRDQAQAGPRRAMIEFISEYQGSCRIIWIDYYSNEVPYTVLQPGQRAVYRSWGEHVWIARDVQSGRRLCINGAQAVIAHTTDGHTAAITQPPVLHWDQHTGSAFPQQFRTEARSLLLCWRRLGAAGPSSSSGSSDDGHGGCSTAADLGALDFGLVMHIIRQHLAPDTLWQEACLPPSCHRDILPTQLHSLDCFDSMLDGSRHRQGSDVPPRSRMSIDQLSRSVLSPPPAPAPAPSSTVHALTNALNGVLAALIGGS